jgi:hypothetical protein
MQAVVDTHALRSKKDAEATESLVCRLERENDRLQQQLRTQSIQLQSQEKGTQLQLQEKALAACQAENVRLSEQLLQLQRLLRDREKDSDRQTRDNSEYKNNAAEIAAANVLSERAHERVLHLESEVKLLKKQLALCRCSEATSVADASNRQQQQQRERAAFNASLHAGNGKEAKILEEKERGEKEREEKERGEKEREEKERDEKERGEKEREEKEREEKERKAKARTRLLEKQKVNLWRFFLVLLLQQYNLFVARGAAQESGRGEAAGRRS